VIFGAAGDLTKRLVVPALYNLTTARQLSNSFQLVGVDRAPKSTQEWCAGLTETMKEFVAQDGEFHVDNIDQTAWRWLTERMSYLQGDLNDPTTYRRLREHLANLDKTAGTAGNHLFYLAVADRFFSVAVAGLGAAGFVTESNGQWRRVVIEKPFGHDLPSAKALNADILKTLQEHQIYRIDHFLGKETVQNIMVLRFANGLFEPLWSRRHIDHVQITVAETVGVEHRGKFYEKTGALRDMVPNHVLQLLAMTAMEPPISFDADAVRAKKTEVISIFLWLFRSCSLLHQCSAKLHRIGQDGHGLPPNMIRYNGANNVPPIDGMRRAGGELVALVDEKGAEGWKGLGMSFQGCVLAFTGKATDAVHMNHVIWALLRDVG
jgi:glucose-6-phosphate 1-dehydrogenase